MFHFTSKRERRLWMWVLVVIVSIYATIGLVGSLVGFIRDNELLNAFFFIGMFLVGMTLLTQALKVKPKGVDVAVGFGLAATYIILFARTGVPNSHSHMIEYSVVAIFIYEALKERNNNGSFVPMSGLIAIGITTLIGIIDECIQFLVPNRVFDPLDMLFNFLAATGVVLVSAILGWIHQIFSKNYFR